MLTKPDISSGMSLAQWVYDVLRSDMKEGQFKGGARLSERTIAEKLGVSRTPVREALHRLVERGLLEGTQGGLRVRTLSHSEIVEIYAAREVMEGSVAAFAARNATPAEVANLRRLTDAFTTSGDNARGIWAANRALHTALYAATHNSYLSRCAQELNDPLALVPGTTYSVPGRFEAACKEHDIIIAAIERRDERLAEEGGRAHVRASFEARLQIMPEL